MKRQWITTLLLFLGVIAGRAQPATVTATLDTQHIRIGEPIELLLQARYDSSYQIEWPAFTQKVQSFSLIADSTLPVSYRQDTITATKRYTITAFDTGFAVLEPIAVGFFRKGETSVDTLYTEPLLVQVDFVKVDTTKPFKPIKAPRSVPVTWQERLPYVLIPLMLIALGLIIWYLYKKQKNKPTPISPPKPAPAIPPHEEALARLKALEAEELWQQGESKEYHDRLTDIVRDYIEKRYQLAAMESTTEELMPAFERLPVPRQQVEQLREMLTIADFAKFAKMEPTPEDNHRSLTLARDFIEATRPIDPTKPS